MIKIDVGGEVKVLSDGRFHSETGCFSKCVWMREDGKTATTLCERNHESTEYFFREDQFR